MSQLALTNMRLSTNILYDNYNSIIRRHKVKIIEPDFMPMHNCEGLYIHRGRDIHEDFAEINKSILIRRTVPNYKKLVVVFHELGHHICCKSKCKCSTDSECSLTEIHAHKFCLQELIKTNVFASLFFAMKAPCLWVHKNKMDNDKAKYYYAACDIFKSQIWRKCVEKIGIKTLHNFMKSKDMNKSVFKLVKGT